MAFQNLFILGATGGVGKELINQVQKHDMSDRGHLNPTRIVGIANSRSYMLQPNGIKNGQSFDLNRDLRMRPNEKIVSYQEHREILEAIKKSGLE